MESLIRDRRQPKVDHYVHGAHGFDSCTVKKTILTVVLLAALVFNAGVALWLIAPHGTPKLNAARAAATIDQLDRTEAQPTGEIELNGEWALRTDAPSSVGYRIGEQAAGRDFSTAVGRTNAVTARLVVQDRRMVSVTVDADLRALASDQILRDRMIRTKGLEIDAFPTASFASTVAIDLSALATTGSIVNMELSGSLTLHGVTRDLMTTVAIEVRRATVVVTGSAEITLADFGIAKPQVANILSIADRGTVEWQLFLVRSSPAGQAAVPTSVSTATPPTGSAPGSRVPAHINVAQSAYGSILVDELGRTLYMYGSDTPGSSVCFDDCLVVWPALETVGAPIAGPGVDAHALSTFVRPDGTTQVQYQGMPLYRGNGEQPGEIKCQGAYDVWFVVSPAGVPILDIAPVTTG
jgi:predicted lipoprotein with Yx(FWY)xxD motif/polyisoprenoid-binding protein YceI